MIISPVLVRLFEKLNFSCIIKPFAYITYSWLGFLILFIFFSVSITFLSFFTELSNTFIFFASLILAAATFLYGLTEAGNIKTKTFEIKTDKIPSGKTIKILQISDLHISPTMSNKRFKKIVNLIKNTKHDILVSTGDLLDNQVYLTDGIYKYFLDIKSPLGKFAVLGNHEVYLGYETSAEFLSSLGFKVLKEENIISYK